MSQPLISGENFLLKISQEGSTQTHTYDFVSTDTNKTWRGYHQYHSKVTIDSGKKIKKSERRHLLSKGRQSSETLKKSYVIG